MVGTWSGVEDHAGEETVAEVVSQPDQVAGIVTSWARGRFDLDSDDLLGAPFDEEVHLVPPLSVSHVVELGEVVHETQLWPYLGGDEGIQEPTEQISLPGPLVPCNLRTRQFPYLRGTQSHFDASTVPDLARATLPHLRERHRSRGQFCRLVNPPGQRCWGSGPTRCRSVARSPRVFRSA